MSALATKSRPLEPLSRDGLSDRWRGVVDGFRPDRYDISGAVLCLVGVAVITYAPR